MLGADLPGNSQTVQLWQHDIQQNEVIGKASDIVQGALPVGYERDSFRGLEDPGLRLTLDRDILWRIRGLDLRLGAWGEPLLKEDEILMEIKISNAMPLWLSAALSDMEIFPLSYSKYGRAYQQMEKEMIREDRRYA